MQLYRQLRDDIVSGTLPAGAKLPSKRFLARELEISVITVEHAFGLLLDEGYAVSRERSGLYSAFGGGAHQTAKRAAVEDMSVSAETPPKDFPFSVWAKTMRRVLAEQGERLLVKSPGCGCPELREAIARYLARSRGVVVNPGQIVVGSGSEYLYSMAAQLLGRDGTFALEDPSYEKIRQVYGANGVSCVYLPMAEDGIDSDALSACTASVLHVTPYHSYPSGITATAARRHEYASWAQSRNGYIVEDDYDSEFAASSRRVDTIFSLAPERVIYMNTFTKTLAPSMRMGYMVLPEALMEEYRRKLGFYSCTVPLFEQLVLAEFINNGDFERYINRRKKS